MDFSDKQIEFIILKLFEDSYNMEKLDYRKMFVIFDLNAAEEELQK